MARVRVFTCLKEINTDSIAVKGKVQPTTEEEDEEAELRKLQAEMAM